MSRIRIILQRDNAPDSELGNITSTNDGKSYFAASILIIDNGARDALTCALLKWITRLEQYAQAYENEHA